MPKGTAETALVIVESPTKAKTIKKFLPKGFQVEASMGHVRDLPKSATEIPEKYKKEEWAKIGVNVENDFEPLYVVPKGKSKIITELRKKLQNVDELYLATDEDREGESISWHLINLLKPKVPVKRMVFHEITKSAIQNSLEACRDIDQRLVHAQETRRILDRLVGYTLSPLIWKKIAFGLSAGRVQSAGLRLIIERERERLAFRKAEYWDLQAKLAKDSKEFEANLLEIDGKRVASGKDFDETSGKLRGEKDVVHLNEAASAALLERIKKASWKVISLEEKVKTQKPAAPFITSTLQQEANRKLGLSARDTMRVAQGLYEQGLITYMRTDSPNLSQEGIKGARNAVQSLYGSEYLSPEVRQYTAKSKSAQEAHEAIRPAGEEFKLPQDTDLTGKPLALYELIWKRTVATQMAEAKKLSMSVRISAEGTTFGANGMRITFPGFLRAYVEGSDDPEGALEDREVLLPDLKEGDVVKLVSAQNVGHETKPPARYTEASLVQGLEREGIGRPSTYATIIGTIIERGYVRKLGNALVPTFTGIIVVELLERHFSNLVDYKFTSEMEKSLDEIAEGKRDYLKYLKDFYLGKEGLREQVRQKEKKIDPTESRTVDFIHINGVDIRVGRFGPYVIKAGSKEKPDDVRASIPEDIAPADLTPAVVQEIIEASEKGPQSLGKHPDTGENIYCLLGRYGPYVQLGEITEDVPKPKRASVPKEINYREITLPQAVKLLSLPRVLGNHPETGAPITANLGRFGPYVVHQDDFRSLKEDDVYTVGLDRALEIFAQEKKRGRRGSKVLKELGEHPASNKKIAVYEGKYGPYIKYGSKNLSLPEGKKPEEFSLNDAVALIDEKVGPAKGAKGGKGAAKSAKSAGKSAGKTAKASKSAEA